VNAGLSQQALAGLAGISRQAYSALESGSANPSTEVALRLARALKTSVDRLFSLPETAPEQTEAELIGPLGHADVVSQKDSSARVQLVQVGNRLLARPVSGTGSTRQSLIQAEGVAIGGPGKDNRVAIQPFDDLDTGETSLGLIGCDPAGALMEPALGRQGINLVLSEEGSHQALSALARGEAHIAGCHLSDEETGEFNFPWVLRLVPFPCTLVTFAAWQQGLIVAPGNPHGIRGVEDLARPEIKFINRQSGSGSRALLDRLLLRGSVPSTAVTGYDREAGGHLPVASTVASGQADAGVGVEAAATALGLGFVPLKQERYDLVIPNHFLDHKGVQALLDLLRQPSLRRRVETLGGYDVSSMGLPVSRI
jgi:molybdate-binding protein/transcriptional regulator with XRE-family HTH domain